MVVPVIDPFGVACDPEMPSLALAVYPDEVQRQLGNRLPRLTGEEGHIHVCGIRVTRYKPGRRCLLEYQVEVERPGVATEKVVLIGKVRAGHRAKSGYQLLEDFWNAGFADDSEDEISVPKPIGIVPDFQMWLQRKVSGRSATELLPGTDGIKLARRIVEAACKIHRAGVRTRRRHTMVDELRILHERLPTVRELEQLMAMRIAAVLEAADRLAAETPDPAPCGIHRDFYPDQVIVDGPRLYLVDFDLYCEGDPSLDIGNFIAHVTEQSLRVFGDPEALSEVEQAIEDRFVELNGEATRAVVRAYTTLTLVRHIYLSTLKPERRPFTTNLLELCEQRLGIKSFSARGYGTPIMAA